MQKTITAICLALVSTVILQGAVIRDTKNFARVNKNGMPWGWRFNAGAATVKKVKYNIKTDAKTGKKAFVVDLKALPKNAMPIMIAGTQCKIGDKIIVTAKVKTSGSVGVTLYRYADKKLLKGIKPKDFRIMDRMTTVKAEFVLHNDSNVHKLTRATVVINVPAGKITEIEEVKVELIKAKGSSAAKSTKAKSTKAKNTQTRNVKAKKK